MNDPSETNSERRPPEASRRKLLRLGVAAPMVLTLVPGSSFADSGPMCARKLSETDQQRGELADKLISAPADEWIRAQVDIVTLRPRFGEEEIKGSYVLSTDKYHWWEVDSGGATGGSSIASMKSTPRVTFGNRGAVGKDGPKGESEHTVDDAEVAEVIETRLAMVKIDPESGLPLGYSWEPNAAAGIFATVGCGASIMGISEQYTGGFGEGLTAYVRRILGLT